MILQIKGIIKSINDAIVNNGVDWIITAVVTFITVRFATKKYYNSVKARNVRPHMEQGLKSILDRKIIPANAKSILVENRGFTVFRWRKYKCTHPFSRLRKTICTVGGNENSTSEARARFWGVLGLAYRLMNIVVYDFKQHKLLVYDVDITERQVLPRPDKSNNILYYYKGEIDSKLCEFYLSNETTGRNIMIAVPLFYEHKLVGGVTFDVDCEINEQADPENRKKYLIGNSRNEVVEICKTLNDLGSNIVCAYFAER